MWPVLGGLLSGGLGLISGLFNSQQSGENVAATNAANAASQEKSQAFNAEQAELNRSFQSDQAARAMEFAGGQASQQMQFQKDMSSSAYQRSRRDMEAAGLNPMMMFGSGGPASTPSGAAGSGSMGSGSSASSQAMRYDYSGRQSAGGAGAAALQQAIPNAVALKTADATIENLVAQNAKIKADTLTETKRPALVEAETGLTRGRDIKTADERELVKAQSANVKAGLPLIVDTSHSAKNRLSLDPTVRSVADKAKFLGDSANHAVAPVANLISSAKGVRSLFNDRFYY